MWKSMFLCNDQNILEVMAKNIYQNINNIWLVGFKVFLKKNIIIYNFIFLGIFKVSCHTYHPHSVESIFQLKKHVSTTWCMV